MTTNPATTANAVMLGMDAACGLTGWTIATAYGPLVIGHASPTGTWRWDRARRFADEVCARTEEHAARLGVAPRLVVERAPEHYRQFKQRRNDRVTVRALSELIGAVMLRCTAPGWAYPWSVEPDEWRPWWGLQNARRDNAKSFAVQLAAARFSVFATVLRDAEEREDIAESMLIAVGAAKHADKAPKGPAKRSDEIITTSWSLP